MELLLLHLRIRQIRKERGEGRGRGRGVEWSWRGMVEEVMKGKRIFGVGGGWGDEEGGGMGEDIYRQRDRETDLRGSTYY